MSTMRAVYTNFRAARTALKDISRAREIAIVLVRHGFGHFVEAWQLQDKIVLAPILQKRDADEDRLSPYERIALALQDLGPTFVKLGQILSTRPDLIPQELCDELKTLQDHVNTIDWNDAKSVVEESLGRTLDEAFSTFEEEPLASASIAQVHSAALLDGTEVVVKVQRPGIGKKIEADLHILYWLAKKVEETVPEAEAFDPVAIVREFERAISKELDFKFESRNLIRFSKNFSTWDQVYIPDVYEDLSSQTVMVMERLKGRKITEAVGHGYDMEAIAKDCVSLLFKMVFEDGFFHGDLHPGNLWVLEDGRVGLIDFGLVGRMSHANKDAMADLFLSIATKDCEALAQTLYTIGIKRGKTDYSAFEADVAELMDIYFDNVSLANIDFGSYLREIIEGAIRHNLRVPSDFTMFFKAIMTVEGIGKQISPDLDIVAECKPYVERLVAERYSPQRVIKNTADTVQAFARFGQKFPLVAHQFLEHIDDGRINIGVEYPDAERMETARRSRWNRLSLVVLTGVLFTAGIVMRNDSVSTLLGIPWPATLCLTAGGFLGIRLVWRILRSGDW
ncbi:MAG: AarF/UbiB family protein [Myxococcota bacterium]|nr:AarF/UbiB family protein [Myxococcota bacterium]